MAGLSPDISPHGRYKCPYCNHKLWKQYGAASNHIRNMHKEEAEKHELELDNKRLKHDNDALREQLKSALKPKPVAKEVKYYDATIYCATCQRVWSAGMPRGQTFAETPCSTCGNRTLHLVSNIDR